MRGLGQSVKALLQLPDVVRPCLSILLPTLRDLHVHLVLQVTVEEEGGNVEGCDLEVLLHRDGNEHLDRAPPYRGGILFGVVNPLPQHPGEGLDCQTELSLVDRLLLVVIVGRVDLGLEHWSVLEDTLLSGRGHRSRDHLINITILQRLLLIFFGLDPLVSVLTLSSLSHVERVGPKSMRHHHRGHHSLHIGVVRVEGPVAAGSLVRHGVGTR